MRGCPWGKCSLGRGLKPAATPLRVVVMRACVFREEFAGDRLGASPPEEKMRKLAVALTCALMGTLCGFAQTAAPVSTKHEFVLKNFKTESGVVLPEAHVVYGTYGTLNAAHDNVVLLPSHYMAKYRGY